MMNYRIFFPAFAVLLLACNVPYYTSYQKAPVAGRMDRVFVRIATSSKSTDTMRDAMGRFKASLVQRGHEMSGGVFAVGDAQAEAGVGAKLQAYNPAYVLEIVPETAGVHWAPVGEVQPDSVSNSNGRRYLATLFRANDRQPLWYTRVKRGWDIGGWGSANLADGLLNALERDGWIVPEPRNGRKGGEGKGK